MRIGVFDSGLGGLSVLHQAQKMIPDADFIYYADEEHVPYGEKEPSEVKQYVKEILHFLIEQKVDAIVIACNTATTLVDKEYRKQFPVPIVGMEPAVKKAIDLYEHENKRILVTATPITINGSKLHHLVNQVDAHHLADLVALPGLVRFAENGEYNLETTKAYLRNELSSYNLADYGTVVLGCTHFNYFKECFQDILPNDVHFVDGNSGTILQVARLLDIPVSHNYDKDIMNDNVCDTKAITYYFSGKPANEEELVIIQKHLEQLQRIG